MKKAFYIVLLFLLKASTNYAQAKLEMINGVITTHRDTVRLGDSLLVRYGLNNSGDATYTGVITTSMRTNFEAAPVQKSVNKTIEAGKTIYIEAFFKCTKPYFQENEKSIIVIWPTGTGTVIKTDSIRKTVTTIGSVAVQEQKSKLSRVRFYPNPTSSILYFEMLNPALTIQGIQVFDVQGRLLFSEPKHFSAEGYMEMENFIAGVYILEVKFSDSYTARYKVVKSRQ